MNTQTISLLKAIKTETANTINSIAGSQLAIAGQKKTFIAAELWNIHRNGRTLLGRRRTA